MFDRLQGGKFKFLPDFLVSDVVGRFQGADGGAGDFGDLLVGEILEIAHLEDQALFFGQADDRLREVALEGVAVKPGVFVDPVFQRGAQALEREGRADFLLVEEVQRLVGRDAPGPGEEFRVAAEARQGLPDLDETVL